MLIVIYSLMKKWGMIIDDFPAPVGPGWVHIEQAPGIINHSERVPTKFHSFTN